jgi:hypothetical protein
MRSANRSYSKDILHPQIRSLKSLSEQPCVKAIREAYLPEKLKKELYCFIRRNIIKDCNRVPPNCLKAHMINVAIKLNLPRYKIEKLKLLFQSKLGYKGYYLDGGELKKISF